MSNAEIIWNYFKNKNFTDYAIAGILGNMQQESSLLPNNLQNNFNRSLNMTDAQYTQAVDNNTYKNFINDHAGYGIAQFTLPTYKQDLYNICKQKNKSIADINCQLDCLYLELQNEKIIDLLNSAKTVREASDIFLIKFEKPKNQSETVKTERTNYGQQFYNQFCGKGGSGMKYSNNNKPLVCMMTNSTCYKSTSTMSIKGVLWHSTGANNPNIKRYVQPSENDSNYAALLAKIGTNTARNDWNHQSVQAGLNAWIGKLADGSVAAVQTMPWNYKPWGCASGSRGSCNNGWIQFEICEDGLSDSNYFNKIYQEACELTAYLCKMYNLNPNGSVSFNGVSVPVILCHQDSYQLGLGSNHADVYHWFTRHGKTMKDVRSDVAKLMGSSGNITPSDGGNSGGNTNTYPTLRRGSSDSVSIKKLQNYLLQLGYKLPRYGADGDFGQETYNAVIKFQQDNRLAVDGVVGPSTWAAIMNKINSGGSTPIPTPTPTPTPAQDEIYRIRKSWADPKSQIGAFKVLANAKTACDKAGNEYKVFNSKGEIVYSPSIGQGVIIVDNSTTTTNPVVTPAIVYTGVVIGSSSKDENGQYRSGQAGDQTGKEVYTLNWYDGGWNYVIRPKSNAIAEKIASACEKACNNTKVGYDQLERNTLLAEAKKVNMDISKITTPCECDCASLVSTCCVVAGLPESTFFAGGNGRTTNNLLAACESTGQFTTLSNTTYTRSKDYLKRGDILLASGHTVIVLSNGSKVDNIATTTTTVGTFKVKIESETVNVRSGPAKSYTIVTQVKKGAIFTIIEEREGWGKLKSGAGWICLEYTSKV